MKIVVVGLGNPILTDDAAGIRISEILREKIKHNIPESVTVEIFQDEVGGWDIIDLAEGRDVLILVDAMMDRALKPGELKWYPDGAFSSIRLSGIHSMDVFTALEFAKKHRVKVPEKVLVLGVGVNDIHTFSEQCTPEVEAVIEKGADEILQQILSLIPTCVGKR
jgi:hydrogenase maturation protease